MKATSLMCFTSKVQIYVTTNTPVIPIKDDSFRPMEKNGPSPREKDIAALREMGQLNGGGFPVDEPLVHLCFNDDESTDYNTQGCVVELDGDQYEMEMVTGPYVAAGYLYGAGEGEHFTLNFPVLMRKSNETDWVKAIWRAELIPAQRKGPYAILGEFQNVLLSVCQASHRMYENKCEHFFEA